MEFTKNYGLKKPSRGAEPDKADINDLNYNADIIDGELRTHADSLTDHESMEVIDHPNASVTTAKIRDKNVTTAKLADKAVTTEKIEAGSVTEDKIADDAVVDVKVGNRSIGSLSGKLQALFTAIGNAMKAIAGTANWNDAPPTTLTEAKAHADDDTRHVSASERGRWEDTYTKGEADSQLDLKLDSANVTQILGNATDKVPSEKAVTDALSQTGNGDMQKRDYDKDNSGTVDNADKLTTARAVTLSGDAEGSAVFDGSTDVEITVAIPDGVKAVDY